MAGERFTLRDRDGSEYQVEVTTPSGVEVGGWGFAGQSSGLEARSSVLTRVTVGDTALLVESFDGGAMRVGPVDPPLDDGQSGSAPAACRAHAVRDADTLWVFLDGRVFTFAAERPGRRRPPGAMAGSLTAPMPATVRRVEVTAGQAVRRGDVLIVLEAMKMELPVRAPSDGTIARVNCREGDLVQAGQEVVELQP